MAHVFVYFSIILIFFKYYSAKILDSFILLGIIVSGYILMENITVIFLLFVIYKETLKYLKNKKISYLLILSFFLIPLARIDAIALVGFIPLILFIKTRDKFFFYLLISLFFGLISNLTIYFMIAGEFYSVSSYVKMNQNIKNKFDIMNQNVLFQKRFERKVGLH
jgi:hypothetical protein